MKFNKEPLTQNEVRGAAAQTIKAEYLNLAKIQNQVSSRSYLYCHCCDEFLPQLEFYSDARFASKFFPICKDCITKMATDYDAKSDTYKDNIEKAKVAARFMDIPFIYSIYKKDDDEIRNGSAATTGWRKLVRAVRTKSYAGLTYKDSIVASEDAESATKADADKDILYARPEIKKLFGPGFEESDYVFLQDQYDDWCTRTAVDTKSQQTYIIRICFKLLDIWKAQRKGDDTKELDKSLNDLMLAANLQPKQNVNTAASDSLTFGQLIEKWEMEQPIPEPDEEFKDVNNIGKLIRVFFMGHLSKALGLRNGYSKEYEEIMGEYTVLKPEEREDVVSDTYQDIFGKNES